MTENLQAEYDQVVAYLNDYRKFVAKISRRIFPMTFRDPREYLRLNTQTWKSILRFDPLSEKSQDNTRIVVLACANDAEKKHPFFNVATSDYNTDALSDCLKKEFGSFDFGKLKKMHDYKQTQLARFSLGQIIGIVFTASALVLKSVPKSVVGNGYEAFERYVFWGTVALTFYLLLSFLYPWIRYYLAKRTNQRVGDILEYTVIKNA